MDFQNKAILSLGSNSGDRKEHLASCIKYIHSTIGTVIKVSAVYETPAWGFEGTDFYNCCLLIHTCKDALALLESLLAAETEMGRLRTKEEGYEDRVIDIDIISFNDEIINAGNLILPHPRMEQRNFVLYPLRDIDPVWEHPVSGKKINVLIAESEDPGPCTKANVAENPCNAYTLERFNYIAIEGNIGAGKTTLAGKIAEDFNAKLVLERFADNPFLPKFYEDQARYAFPLEMSFLADRYRQLTDDLAQFDLFSDFIVADYHIFKSLIFAKVTLTEDEYRLYRNLFDIIYREMPKPDLYVYLYQNTDMLLQHIKKRGRAYEQDIQPEYLEKINRGYLDYIKSQKDLNVIIIDVSNRDFVKNQQDYLYLLDAIQKALPA